MKKITMYLEGLMTLAIILTTIFFAFMTFGVKEAYTVSRENKISYVPSQYQARTKEVSAKDNIASWQILDVNEDYSLAKILKSDGLMYYVTIYEAYDNIVCFCDSSGNIHEFYYYSK